MAMTKVLGTALQTGVTSSGISGVHEQSATKSKQGTLKVYKDKDGIDISVYATDRYTEYTFDAILESTVSDKEIGETATVASITGVVTKWEIQESNEDVKKVSVGIRTFPDISSNSSSNQQSTPQ